MAARIEMIDLEHDENDPAVLHEKRETYERDLRLYLIRRTVMQMLRDRGYMIGDLEFSMSRDKYFERFGSDIKRQALDMLKSKQSDPSDQIYVFFPDETKIGVPIIRRYAEIMRENNVHRAILVVQKNITKFAQQSVAEISSRFRIEIFQDTEMLVNVKESLMVPEHHLLTADERKEVLERYSVKTEQLPRMLVGDPIARYYGLEKGQMVRIVRPREPTGQSVTYRLLV